MVKDKNSENGYAGYVKTLVLLGSGEITPDRVSKNLELYYRERLEDPIAKAEKERWEREARDKAERERQEREKAEKERLAEEQRKKQETPKTYTNSLGMEFILIPAGEFMMGAVPQDKDAEEDEKPQHRIIISEEFYLGKYLVTQEEWEKIMGNNPSNFKGLGNKLPVEYVSWNDCQEFIIKLQNIDGKKYRLPYEAEWEYAARGLKNIASENYTFISGDDDPSSLLNFAWIEENSEESTHPVGEKLPNKFGIYDMIGNVWEWCDDYFDDKYYKVSPKKYPKGPTKGSLRAARGGSWDYGVFYSRSSYRSYYGQDGRNISIGLRLVLIH